MPGAAVNQASCPHTAGAFLRSAPGNNSEEGNSMGRIPMVCEKFVDNSTGVLEALEQLAAACPWDEVDLWITREPEGKYRYTSYVRANEAIGLTQSGFGHGDTPVAAVQDVLKQIGTRDPKLAREAKIKELKEQIAKLEAVVIGAPPYVPNRELLERNPIVEIAGERS